MSPEGSSPQANQRVRLKEIYLTPRPFGINSPSPPPSQDSSEESKGDSEEPSPQEDPS